ncbi:hypothetical protein FRC12_001661 [Ceratobasidium sp. 428]|nr:hypothetical protein FRC12_001661 [Ceratobasidium sp. 428]
MHALSPAPSPSPSPSPRLFFSLNTTSRDPPQALPTTPASPLAQFPLGSSRDFVSPPFAAPLSNTVHDGSKYIFHAPYGFSSVTTRQPADNNPPAYGSAPGHDRQWVTTNAVTVASPDLHYLPEPPSLPSLSSTLVHRRHRFSRSAGLAEPLRNECSSHPLGRGVNLSGGSEEDPTPGYKSPLASDGLCDLDVRRRRIVEGEQRRRNDLRGGFARLKDALPVSHEKCSKVVLLDRATTYIGHLEAMLQERWDGIGVAETRRPPA